MAIHSFGLHAPRRLRFPRLYRILGRFRSWKRIQATWKTVRQAVAGTLQPNLYHVPGTLFGGFQIGECIRHLREEGYFPGLQLPQQIVNDILDHARKSFCICHPDDAERFLITTVKNGRTPRGTPVAVADVETRPSCGVIDRIAADPLLIEVTRRYLGYRPQHVRSRLYWSPASDLPDEVRRKNGQTIDFHYDIEPSNALYVFFYITGADRRSGAHVTVAKSHGRKPLPLVLASSFQPEERVRASYGEENEVVIEGGPGFGFFEDPAAYHRAMVPRERDRLVLQLRYS